jgi:hypothetical protein
MKGLGMDQLLTRKTERASEGIISANGRALHGGAKRLSDFNLKPLGAMLLAACFLSACGGGGSDSTPVSGGTTSGTSGGTTGSTTGGTTGTTTGGSTGGTTGTTTGGTTTAALTMSCPDGAGYQCSGSDIIKVENGITLTSSGVETYGKATSDLTNPPAANASGFAVVQDANNKGIADIRVKKDASGAISSPAVILKNLGLFWDGTTERPPIIETFNTAQGRTVMNANGTLSNVALPTFDYNTTTGTGTQANYANNRYFPRTAPSVCPTGMNPCPTTETTGVRNLTLAESGSDWRTGGVRPDVAEARRLHEDGDVHAGTTDGVPFPGSKGYRDFTNLAYKYVNLGSWVTQDTVQTVEWAHLSGNMEHNTNRRGMAAFGEVTDPATVPTTGTATYSGIVQGWYSATSNVDPTVFRGDATVTVNFATRQVTITVANTKTYDATQATVPATFTATTTLGAAGAGTANYMTGTVDAGTLKGGISGRYFGPVAATGSSGAGPTESGGTFSLSNATSGASVVGGFIALKQ